MLTIVIRLREMRGDCQSGRMIRLTFAEGNLPCSTLRSMVLIEKSPCSRKLRTSVGVIDPSTRKIGKSLISVRAQPGREPEHEQAEAIRRSHW